MTSLKQFLPINPGLRVCLALRPIFKVRGCRFAAAGQTASGNSGLHLIYPKSCGVIRSTLLIYWPARSMLMLTHFKKFRDWRRASPVKVIWNQRHNKKYVLTDDIRLPFLERSVSFEPRAGRVSPRQNMSISISTLMYFYLLHRCTQVFIRYRYN